MHSLPLLVLSKRSMLEFVIYKTHCLQIPKVFISHTL